MRYVTKPVATAVFTDEAGTERVIYHETCVAARYRDGRIRLDSGGWRTKTTLQRINQFGGVNAYQKNHCWYVGHGGKRWEFRDGMTLKPDGTVDYSGA